MNSSTLSSSKATIIIAAYNEASLIRSTLNALLSDKKNDYYQVLVICNGCTDNTEKIIHDEFETVLCHSIPQASKSLAIRYAESLKPGFPRLYLDADIELNAVDAVDIIRYTQNRTNAALVIPASSIYTKNSDYFVRCFYRAWYNTFFVQQLGFGAGAYLLNKAARSRFDLWPELIADDGFIRSQFDTQETHVLSQYQVRVKAPKNLLSLIKVKSRSKLGNIELDKYLSTKGSENSLKNTKELIDKKNTTNSFDKFIYRLINITALTLAKWHSFTGFKSWSRDNSNRF